IRIGKRCNIQDASVLHVTHESNEHSMKVTEKQMGYPLVIGDDVTVGHKALLHACTIGNTVLVGMGATVMDGAIVEDQTIIAAGSLVPPRKTLESGYLWVGSPAKKARQLTDKEKAYLMYSAEHYVQLKIRTVNS
ncbi:MAG: gamma carbonic anhydrase family protein, partial [Gammaproteobacteria bacterium]|nr:gamma carbonic anhydrase family protein [Gammaproteobacteria bacterium]